MGVLSDGSIISSLAIEGRSLENQIYPATAIPRTAAIITRIAKRTILSPFLIGLTRIQNPLGSMPPLLVTLGRYSESGPISTLFTPDLQ